MAVTSQEYEKLVKIALKMRLAESILAETTEEIRKANEVLRELILRRSNEK